MTILALRASSSVPDSVVRKALSAKPAPAMPRCPHCQNELTLPLGAVCPHCSVSLAAEEDVTIELGDPNATVDFAGEGTIEFDASPETGPLGIGPPETGDDEVRLELGGESGEDKTIELPAKHPTEPFAADATIDFGAETPREDQASVSLDWEQAADEAGDPSRTLVAGKTTPIGQTVSGQRSSLPIKSRSLQNRTQHTTPSRSLSSAQTAPDYELLDLLGQGGMGVVYAAKQSSIARTVAVKMLKPGGKTGSGSQGSSDQRDKFISEAVITGELEHPNIVPIYDLGANDEGALFYSMKRVRGTPWDEVFRKRSLSENLTTLMRVADAIAFAHASGVVHRDLKPENVMLGGFGEVLVMDWGLARVTPEFRSADSVHQSDSLGGTPAYMAPEMACGPVESIDERSDIYLLGAILYELIGSKPPHTGRDVMACLMSAAKNEIRPLDEERAAQAPQELLAIAHRAMATRQGDRYQSVKDFQAAIQEYLSHAESVTLTTSAQRNLDEAKQTNDYQPFARALYGCQEAIDLWSGNARAKTLLIETRLAYARSARDKGDYDLGASLLTGDTITEAEIGLRDEIAALAAERETRKRRLRDLKRLAMALLLAVIGIGSYASYEINRQKNEAITQREIAEENEREAETQRRIAEQKKEEALVAQAAEAEQRQEAERQEKIAAANAVAAQKSAQEAIASERKAVASQKVAEAAQTAEAYEAYVARIGLAAAKIEENAFREALGLLEECPPELRQWEWGRLRYLCELSESVYDLGTPVDAVAYAPDGETFVSGDWNGEVVLRNAATGAVRWRVKLCRYLHAVAFSPKGRWIATGGSDGKVRLLDAATGETRLTLTGHDDAVLTVAFSPDGGRLVTGGYDETVRLWDLSNGKEIDRLIGHNWWVWSAQFSPDGNSLVTTSQDGKAIVWHNAGESFEQQTEFTGHEGPVYSAAFSPDGDSIATAGYDQTVCVWRPDLIQPIDLDKRIDGEAEPPSSFRRLRGHAGPVRSVSFSPNGKRLLSGAYDNTLRVWNLEEEEISAQTLRGHGGRIHAVAFSPDGAHALSGGHDSQVRAWNLGEYRETTVLQAKVLRGHSDAVLSAAFSPDGQRVVTASRDRSARIWDTETGKTLFVLSEGHEFLASTAKLFDKGRRLATAAGDNTVRVWNVAAGVEQFSLDQTGRSAALAVPESGDWLATGGPKGSVQVWNTKKGKRIAQLTGHETEVTAAAATTGLLATGDERGVIRLWRRNAVGEWNAAGVLRGHSRSITALAFTPNAERLVSASGDRTCGQWDVRTGTELRPLVLKHPEWVAAMDLSDDGRFALTTCDDGKVRLWQLADAKIIAQHESKETIFNSVDLAPDGNTALLTSSGDAIVYRWKLNSGARTSLEPFIDFSKRNALVWSARYADNSSSVLTIGGNDAQLWRVDPVRSVMRFSPHGAVADAAFSPDGQLVATGSWDHSAKLWNATTGTAIRKLDGAHTGFVNSVGFSPDGQQLLTASDDATARLWHVASGKPTGTVFRGHTGRVLGAQLGPHGERVLTFSADHTARLWNARTGAVAQTFRGHDWAVLCGAISADGHLIATGSEDNTARLWDARTGKLLHTLSGHSASVASIAISPDGQRILTGGQDNLAKLWDAHTGKEVLTLATHADEVTSVTFRPDGQMALTASRNGVAILWPVAAWKPVAAWNED